MKREIVVKSDYIDKSGYYTIENYDRKLPFASFMAGIAGIHGIPMWSFYVNRGQAISSIGIRDKDNCIMEFFPANEAYKMVYTNGFRTFIKVIYENKEEVIEPFGVTTSDLIERTIKIKNNELKLIEINNEENLKTEVTYFTIPNEDFAALSRKVKVTNLNDENIKVEILDGLTSVLPYGSKNIEYKEIGNTLRSWMEGYIIDGNTAIYKVRSSTGDSTKMDEVKNGYFYCAFDYSEKSLKPIVDPEKIFGFDTSLKEPVEFYENSISSLSKEDKCYNKVPCAFAGNTEELEPQKSTVIYSYIGYMNSIEEISTAQEKIINKEYFEEKCEEGNEIIDNALKCVETESAYPLFDEYIKQCYMDNVLRGGYPLKIGGKIYYVYSRKHGDLERDYNFFSIEPNFYSQGNGNFRDVNQNRRMDNYIHPFVGTENIKLFNELVQLDGYNPLVIKGKKLYVDDNGRKEILKLINNDASKLEEILKTKFTVGEVYSEIRKLNNYNNKDIEDILEKIVFIAKEDNEADFGEGFWIDHWTYNLDLIEEYLNIYPDKLKELLIEDKGYKFFNSPEYVLPREERYELDNEKVRQYVCLGKKGNVQPWVRDKNGNIYKVNLLTKLVMLAGTKFMSLDNMGFGIEMEGGKPGWNDAMNGLPGLLGSSFAETAELQRLLLFIRQNLNVVEGSLQVPLEFYTAMTEVNGMLSDALDNKVTQFDYWNKVSNIKEVYRASTNYEVSGENKEIYVCELEDLLNKMIEKINIGIKEIKKLNDGKIPTFMYYDVVKYELNEKNQVRPLEFKVNFLPMFLEGAARYLKIVNNIKEKHEIYDTTINSDVYDKKLKMYKTSESLEAVSFEIGRARTFTPGWLERESVFMHMEFKYILELIKSGLYDEFFESIKSAMPPFMDPEVYGRSILENSSFIASSSNPDEHNHGRGFVARLSGTTVEMLNIWKLMMVGNKLFTYKDEVLTFELNPILSKDFFKNGVIKTTLLGSIKLTYINPENKNTFGEDKGIINKLKIVDFDGNEHEFYGNKICGEMSLKIRDKKIKEIEAVIL